MNNRNLMPARLLAAKRRKKATHRWTWLNSLTAATLAIVGIVMFASRQDTTRSVHALPHVDEEKLNASLVSLRQESARLKTNLHAIQDLSDGPDWSVLLCAVSQSLGDDVVLNAVDCRVGATSGTQSSAANDSARRMLRIGGLGRSQLAVTQFILRMESLKLFSDVQLVQSVPQTLNGSECVGFHLACTFARTMPEGQ